MTRKCITVYRTILGYVIWMCGFVEILEKHHLKNWGKMALYTVIHIPVHIFQILVCMCIVLVFNVFCNSLMPATIFDLKIYLDSKIFKLCQFFQNCIEVLEAICRGDFGSCVSAAQDYQTKCHRLFPLCPSFIIPANSQPDQILANGS